MSLSLSGHLRPGSLWQAILIDVMKKKPDATIFFYSLFQRNTLDIAIEKRVFARSDLTLKSKLNATMHANLTLKFHKLRKRLHKIFSPTNNNEIAKKQ
jgi:hypothetical protein